jgi:hypothetical protein
MTTLRQEFELSANQANAAYGALRFVLEAGGGPSVRGTSLLALAAETLEVADAGASPPFDAADVLEAFPSSAARRALVEALIIPACIDGEVTVAAERAVTELARALGVRSPFVELLPAFRQRRVLRIKRELARRSPDARRLLARTWAEEGALGLVRALLFVLGLHRDPPLARRFRALGALPEGTLGRAFHDHLASRNLPMPGERGGIPERMVHHDLLHVVNGYGTDPAGECELAGFYAAFAPGDAFTFIATVLATFHLGLPVSPAVVVPSRHAFDARRVLAAYLRGRRLAVDVMGPWDYWSLMPLPMVEAQRRLGLVDRVPAQRAL